MRKKLFTLLLAVAAGVGTMFAEKVQIGDLYYNLDATNQTAEVTSQNSSYPFWSTTITTANIPASVTYNSVSYSVTSIGESAFDRCSGLTSIEIPNSVTSIGGFAFFYCTGLTSITIPNSVTSIGEYAFDGCSGLTSVTIGNSVTSIGAGAFVRCTSLTSVTIGNSVTSIGEGAFSACINLKTINVDADNSNYCSMNGVLFNKDKTQLIQYPGGKQGASYTIPNSVTSIGLGAFYLSGLTSIDIPNSVTSIGDYAFSGCMNLTSIVIGNGVKEIRESTFVHCPLKSITIGTGIRKIVSDAFFNIEMNGINKEGLPEPKWDAAGNFIYTVEKVICYSKVPPAIEAPSYGGDLKIFLDNFLEADIYVPKESVARYQAYNDTWGKLGILPIEAATTDVTDLIVTPSSSSAEITWPQVSGAASYELVIKDKSGNVVCTLIFNAQGQLTSIVFNAPSRDDAPQHTQTAGFAFTVTGLEAGTSYDLTITAKNEAGQELDKKEISFHTDGTQGIEDIHVDSDKPVKVLMDGQIYILRGEYVYDTEGKMVK